MLPRSFLLFLGLCSAQQFQQYYQPQQYQPQQQQFSQFYQPQYDQQQFQAPPQQFQTPPQQPTQFQQFQNPQYQPQSQPQQVQFAQQQPPIYQPQFQPVQPIQYQPQQPVQYQSQSPPSQSNFAPQQTIQQQFAPQPSFQPVNQSPRLPSPQQFQAPPQQFQQPPSPPAVSQPVYQPQQAFREQPVIFEQTFKVPFKQPPPSSSSIVQQPQIFQIGGPPPPQKFVPYISDIFNPSTDLKPPVITVISPDSRLPPGTYIAEEIVVDGNHPSFIENIEKFQPAIVKVPPRQPPKPAFVPPPQTKLKAPEIVPVPQQRAPRPPPPPQIRQPPPAQNFRPTVPKVAPPQPASISSSGAKTANDVFLGCCKKRNVHKSCERICNFDILNKKTLTGMFLGTDPCPQSYGLDLLQCGASNDDHTQCCIENEVDRTSAGKKCLGFCNMKPGVTFQADVSMLPCWGVLNDIKACFKDHIEEQL